jgi:putative transposase
VLAELRDRVRAVELAYAAERQRTGRRIYGRRAVLAQPWTGHPTSREPRRNLRPRVAAPSKWARIEALLRNRAFVTAYTSARAAWREGLAAVFSPGTYWLRRFAYVAVAET